MPLVNIGRLYCHGELVWFAWSEQYQHFYCRGCGKIVDWVVW